MVLAEKTRRVFWIGVVGTSAEAVRLVAKKAILPSRIVTIVASFVVGLCVFCDHLRLLEVQ